MFTQTTDQSNRPLRRQTIIEGYQEEYRGARKRDKGEILDEIVTITGWSRDHARRRLSQLASVDFAEGDSAQTPHERECKYSSEARETLERVWDWSGRQSGKYLSAVMPVLLDALERHGALSFGRAGYSAQVREELLSVSAASIDRYLRSIRSRDVAEAAVSTKRSHAPSAEFFDLLGAEADEEPGVFLIDTVAHAGPTVARNCVFTLSAACLRTGWVFTRSLSENAAGPLVEVLQRSLDDVLGIPFWVSAVEMGNASEDVHDVVGMWAESLDILYSPVVKDHRRDRPPEASKHQHLVHEYAGIARYDTVDALICLNRLWRAVNDRLNFFTPTRKPVAWRDDEHGVRRRLYDDPMTPFDRLRVAGVMSPQQEAELIAYRDGLDPATLSADIDHCRTMLLDLAA